MVTVQAPTVTVSHTCKVDAMMSMKTDRVTFNLCVRGLGDFVTATNDQLRCKANPMLVEAMTCKKALT
nr:hypothetical protein Itr_chr09CG06810 [Ipomoea trifida]